MTKRDVLNAIKEVVEDKGKELFTGEVNVDDVLEYVEVTLGQLDKKAEKAKERAEKNKQTGDELRGKIAAVLTNEFQTIAEITEQIDVEDITPAKVSARLSQLVRLNQCHKTKVKCEDGRVLTAYAAGPAPEAEDDAE